MPEPLYKLLAFDLEIAKPVPGSFDTWRAHRPLGISCAATHKVGEEPRLWYGRAADGSPAPAMRQDEIAALLNYLTEAAAQGWTVVTWNGLQFDFDVLAEESGCREACIDLARAHTDLMFHVFCAKGYPLALQKAAQGMGLPGKLDGVNGEMAPILWQQGRHERVLEYVAQDARTTLGVALAGSRRRALTWLSSAGKPQRLDLPQGWLNVQQANALPQPDTAWMRTPMSRAGFFNWMGANRT